MRALRLTSGILIALAAAAGPASAEGPAGSGPAAPGTWAAGCDLGFSNQAGDNDLDADPMIGGYVERFTTPRVSWRGALSIESMNDPRLGPGFPRRDVDILSVTGNVVYNWEGRHVQPFVTGGVGFYEYDPAFADDDLEVGTNIGGGLNVVVAPNAALKFEGLLHATSADVEPDSFYTATSGIRFRFYRPPRAPRPAGPDPAGRAHRVTLRPAPPRKRHAPGRGRSTPRRAAEPVPRWRCRLPGPTARDRAGRAATPPAAGSWTGAGWGVIRVTGTKLLQGGGSPTANVTQVNGGDVADANVRAHPPLVRKTFDAIGNPGQPTPMTPQGSEVVVATMSPTFDSGGAATRRAAARAAERLRIAPSEAAGLC